MTKRRAADLIGMALLTVGFPAVSLLSIFALTYGWTSFETWAVCAVVTGAALSPLIHWVVQNTTPDMSEDPTFGWGGEIR